MYKKRYAMQKKAKYRENEKVGTLLSISLGWSHLNPLFRIGQTIILN